MLGGEDFFSSVVFEIIKSSRFDRELLRLKFLSWKNIQEKNIRKQLNMK